MFFEVGILKCVFLTFNWLTFTSKMYFVKFHPSCHSPEAKERMHPWKWGCYENTFKKLFSGIPLNFHFVLYLRNYKEFKAEILDLQKERYGISFDIKKCTTSGWALGDENVIGIFIFQLNSPGGAVAINSQIFIKRVTTGKNEKVDSLHVPAIG